MQFQGTFAVRAPKEKVFAFFLTPDELSTAIADAHTIETVDQDHFKGIVKTGIGFIKGTFTWSAAVKERSPPDRARLQVRGSGMGSGFDVDALMEMEGTAHETTVRWKADVNLNGTIAQVGGRLLQGTVDKKTKEFFENARQRLEAP